jgi:hypothetical protein
MTNEIIEVGQAYPQSFQETRTYAEYFFGYFWLTAAERNLRNRFDALREHALDIEQVQKKQNAMRLLSGIREAVEVTKQYTAEKEEAPEFIRLQRFLIAFSYGIIKSTDKGFIIEDFTNNSLGKNNQLDRLSLQPKISGENPHITGQREVIDNNIRFASLGFFGRSYFSFVRFWHDYHAKPGTNMLIVGILVGFLLYLQGGLLNFTPVSTILLSSMLVLSIPLISTFCYVNISRFIRGQTAKAMDRTREDDEKTPIEDVTMWDVMSNLFRFKTGGSLVLWSTALLSGVYFLLAVSNNLAYSAFLTSSAVSFLPFATTLWGCFACSAVAMIILYVINREFIYAETDDKGQEQETSQLPYSILGVECEPRNLSSIVFRSAYALQKAGANFLYPTFEDAQKVLTIALRDTQSDMNYAEASSLQTGNQATVITKNESEDSSLNISCSIS